MRVAARMTVITTIRHLSARHLSTCHLPAHNLAEHLSARVTTINTLRLLSSAPFVTNSRKVSFRVLLSASYSNRMYTTTTSDHDELSANDDSETKPLRMRKYSLFPDIFSKSCRIRDKYGTHVVSDISKRATIVSDCMCDILKTKTLNGVKIALLCSNDISYVVALWAIWLANGVAVPLSPAYPAAELEYFIRDSGSQLLLYTGNDPHIEALALQQEVTSLKLAEKDYNTKENRTPANISFHRIQREAEEGAVNTSAAAAAVKQKLRQEFFRSAPALIIYTSGTTGKPKVSAVLI